MNIRFLEAAAVLVAAALVVASAVLVTWGLVDGIVALKLYLTLGILGLGFAFAKAFVVTQLQQWQGEAPAVLRPSSER